MKQEYIYALGKCSVKDDKLGWLEPEEYTDNFKEIILKKNLIENLERCLKNKEIAILKNSVKNKKWGIPVLIFGGVLTGVSLFALTYLGLLTFVGIFSLISGFFLNKVENLRESAIDGCKSEISFIKEQIKEEKANLNTLLQEKNKEKEAEIAAEFEKDRTPKVLDYKLELETLKSLLQIYYEAGYNKKKYVKYYKRGILDVKLQKEGYSKEKIKIIEEFIEKEALVKRK